MTDWRDEAACLNSPILFDDPDYDPTDRGAIRARREAQAKEVCWGKCNVRVECLSDALKHETPGSAYNIRGGMTGDERRALLKKQARDRDRQKKREARLAEKEMVAA